MRTLSVQFQPRRSGGLESSTVSGLMLRIALDTDVRTFLVERSRARDSYLNFLFSSATAARTWRALRRIALSHRTRSTDPPFDGHHMPAPTRLGQRSRPPH